MAVEIYGAQCRGQAQSEAVCIGLSPAGRNSLPRPQKPHSIDEETEAGKGKVPYSQALSWCEARPGSNPSLSETPHHTLLLKTAQGGRAECWGAWVGRDGLISYKHLPAVPEIPAPRWPNPFEGQSQN